MYISPFCKISRFMITGVLAFLILSPAVGAAAVGGKATHSSRTVTVTDANNNGSVTLHPGDHLVVRLQSNVSTGYSWLPVMDPSFPLRLDKYTYISGSNSRGGHHIVGAPGTAEFHFSIPASASSGSMTLAAWQRMLLLRPFEPGVKDANLWQIRVVLAPAGS